MAPYKNQSDIVALTVTFYLNDRTTDIYSLLLYTVVCQIINIFGIVTNIINIVCFVKQGLRDSTNISLLGLSVADLASIIMIVGCCVLATPAVQMMDLPFESTDVSYLVFVMPHFVFTRVSSCITALITLERCLSVVSPLKVKRIITPSRAGMSVAGMFIISIFSATPLYVVNRLGRTFSISRNKTTVGLTFSDDKEQVEIFTFSINNFFIPLCAFVIVAVCTVILTSKLRNNTEWRQTMKDTQAKKISSRNKKVAKMVIAISTLFIVCFVPNTIIIMAVAFVPAMSINGKYYNASKILCGFTLILESINSSVNIFIYHHMSTKYRDTFRKLLLGRTKIQLSN